MLCRVTRTVVIAPDSFKGSLSALGVAEAIAEGWREERPDDRLIVMPQADGGEGTLDVIEAAVKGAVRRSAGLVTGPDGGRTPGEWLQLPDGTAVVELAQCSGLTLMGKLDPLGATTRGVGEIIRAALTAGATSITIGLGSSASTDAGIGALCALGLHVLDASGRGIAEGGGALSSAVRIDRDGMQRPPVGGTALLTDVSSPLLGEKGAAAVFGPQKGANPKQVALLEAGLAQLEKIVGGHPEMPGTGAAGGAGYGFSELWSARIISGADYIATLAGLDAAIGSADILVTGEGKFDLQSFEGKVVGQTIDRARRAGVRVGVIAGQLAAETGGWALSLSDLAGSAAAAIQSPATWLREAGARAAREL
jgi:glycerate 2-kinase